MTNEKTFKHIIGEISEPLAKKPILDKFSQPKTACKASRSRLLEVKLPKKWRHRSITLSWDSPEVALRLDTLKHFNEEHNFLTNKVKRDKSEAYVNDFFKYLYEKTSTEIYDYPDGRVEDCDDFLRNTVVEVVVLRKIKDSKLSVISFSGEEFCIEVEESFPGLDIKIGVGDVLRVFKPKKEGGKQTPELVGCYHVKEEDAKQFLENLVNSDSTLEDFSRCKAVWDYILNDEFTTTNSDECKQKRAEYCEGILQVCDIVQSLHSKLPAFSKEFWATFKGSKFFTDVLPLAVQEGLGKSEELRESICVFVTNIISFVPTCGIKAHEILEQLPLEATKENMQFLRMCFGRAVENVEGVKEDSDSLKWNQKPLVPSSCELISNATNWKSLPKMKVKKDDKFSSVAEYLKTVFILLREEGFYNLKEGIWKFLVEGKVDCKSVMLYRIKLAKGDKEYLRQGLSFKLNFEYAKKDDNAESDPDNSRWLMCNNLLCISLDSSFRKPIWATVTNRRKKDQEESMKKKEIFVTFCSERNSLSDAEIITKLQKLNGQGRKAYMFESNTFYVAFGPPLDILQHKEHVTFEEQIVKVQKCTDSPPDYLKNIKIRPKWKIIFENPLTVAPQGYTYEKLLEEFGQLRRDGVYSKPILDEKQLDAVNQALRNKLALIQGPPGTGKSFVGVRLLHLLLSILPEDAGPILVATYKNFALDHFLNEGMEQIPHFSSLLARVGSGGDLDNELESCRLYNLRERGTKKDLEWKLERQLDVMRPEIQQLTKQLMRHKYSDIPHIFIKEADDKHLKALIEDEFDKLQRSSGNFREKKYKRLLELIKEPLEQWLPTKEEFLGETRSSPDFSNSDVQFERCTSVSDGKDGEDFERCSDPTSDYDERFNAFDDFDETEIDQDDNSIVDDDDENDWTLPDIPEERLGNWKSILNTGNINKLPASERIQLVYALKQQHFRTVNGRFRHLAEEIKKKNQMLKELREQRDIEILKKRRVIGMTVSGAAMRANWLEVIKPSVMIIEEAAEILEPQLVSIISSSVQHLIMIGDQKQLRPQVSHYKLHRECNLGTSMFERLVVGGLDCTQLSMQGRMTDDIANLVRVLKIYDKYETRPQSQSNVSLLAHLKQLPPMFFYTHTFKEDQDKFSNSKCNKKEAEKVVQFAGYLCKNKVDPLKITILCSYLAQVNYLKNLVKKSSPFEINAITITTIDSFQGKENEIIILSLVRSGDLKEGKIGYLSSLNRICVAVSRARRGIYFFGNDLLLNKKSSKGWGKVITCMKEKGYLGKVESSFPFTDMGETVENDGPVGNPMQPTHQPDGGVTNISIAHCDLVYMQAGSDNQMNINKADSGSETPTEAAGQDDNQPPTPSSAPPPSQETARQQENQQTQTTSTPSSSTPESSSQQEMPSSGPGTTVEPTEETRKSDGPEPMPQEQSSNEPREMSLHGPSLQGLPGSASAELETNDAEPREMSFYDLSLQAHHGSESTELEPNDTEPREMSFHDPSLQGHPRSASTELETDDTDQRHPRQDTNPPGGKAVQNEGRVAAGGTTVQGDPRIIGGTTGQEGSRETIGIDAQGTDLPSVGTSVQEVKSNNAIQETALKHTPEMEPVQDTGPNKKE